jgi:hypothetical protein
MRQLIGKFQEQFVASEKELAAFMEKHQIQFKQQAPPQ